MVQKTTLWVLLFLAGAAVLGMAGEAPVSSSRRTAMVEAVGRAIPCVASISTERKVSVQHGEPQRQAKSVIFNKITDLFWGKMAPTSAPGQVRQALGSAVAIHPAGYLLTNFHVTERASRILVAFDDGRSYSARFVAGDEASDLALIKIDPEAPLPTLELSDGGGLLLGESVIAVGNPFGLGQTVTAGILSARNRQARYEGVVLFNDILQTDAAINPGSSGGPLLDLDANIIGINVAMYEEGQNIGFAVPSARVRELLASWMEPALLGNIALGFSVEARGGGVVVTQAMAGLPVQTGDQILEVHGQPARSLFDFYRALLPVKAGDTLPLLIDRSGKELSVRAPVMGISAAEGARLAREKLGLLFALADETGRLQEPVTGEGLLIEEAVPDGPAAKAGLKAGQAVLSINGAQVDSLADLAVVLDGIAAGSNARLLVLTLTSEQQPEITARQEIYELRTP